MMVEEREEEKKSGCCCCPCWCWILLVILAILLGVGIWYYTRDDNSSNNTDTNQQDVIHKEKVDKLNADLEKEKREDAARRAAHKERLRLLAERDASKRLQSEEAKRLQREEAARLAESERAQRELRKALKILADSKRRQDAADFEKHRKKMEKLRKEREDREKLRKEREGRDRVRRRTDRLNLQDNLVPLSWRKKQPSQRIYVHRHDDTADRTDYQLYLRSRLHDVQDPTTHTHRPMSFSQWQENPYRPWTDKRE